MKNPCFALNDWREEQSHSRTRDSYHRFMLECWYCCDAIDLKRTECGSCSINLEIYIAKKHSSLKDRTEVSQILIN